jgi:hypothetical protein
LNSRRQRQNPGLVPRDIPVHGQPLTKTAYFRELCPASQPIRQWRERQGRNRRGRRTPSRPTAGRAATRCARSQSLPSGGTRLQRAQPVTVRAVVVPPALVSARPLARSPPW